MIGWISLAGLTLPVYRRTWIVIPPSVSPADLLVCAQSTLYVPALEVLPVEELVMWAALRGLSDYSCHDAALQQVLHEVLRRDYGQRRRQQGRCAPARLRHLSKPTSALTPSRRTRCWCRLSLGRRSSWL